MPENCEPARFDLRVNDALEHHIPYLSRPFPNIEQVSAWVIEQLPPDLSADGRWLDSSLTAVQRADPERVARLCLEIVEKAYAPDLKVDGPLSEFLRGRGR